MLLIEGVTLRRQVFKTWEFTDLKWCFVFAKRTTLLSSTPFPLLAGGLRGWVSLLPSVYRALCRESPSGCQVTPPRKVLGPCFCSLIGFPWKKACCCYFCSPLLVEQNKQKVKLKMSNEWHLNMFSLLCEHCSVRKKLTCSMTHAAETLNSRQRYIFQSTF